VANDFEHDAVGIEEVAGVALSVLGELARCVDDLGVVSNL
jgi:hypothetical protein